MKELPVSEQASELVAATRAANEAILKGKDDRLLVVVGPCSIHDQHHKYCTLSFYFTFILTIFRLINER